MVSTVGTELYDKFFRNYTRKQWDLDPSELDASVTARVPDAHQPRRPLLHGHVPGDAAPRLHPDVRADAGAPQHLGDARTRTTEEHQGRHPVQDARLHRARRRVLRLPLRQAAVPLAGVQARDARRETFQPAPVVNFPNEHAYTRCTEFKYLTGQEHPSTAVVYEYPQAEGDPYYPIPRPENAALYRKYQMLAEAEPDVHFVGRLATYRYYNMDQVVGAGADAVRRDRGARIAARRPTPRARRPRARRRCRLTRPTRPSRTPRATAGRSRCRMSEPSPAPSGVFQSFLMGGFECSSHRRRDGRRVDVVGATRHDVFAAEDYRALARHGIRSVRDGLRWPLVEASPWQYNWASWLGPLRAARETGTQVVWDLCHYGVPDGLDVWAPAFVDRFAAFARRAAEVHRDETDAVPLWCPVNEISFWSWAGGDRAIFPPFAEGRSFEFKVQLARAAIEAAHAVRDVDPRARLVWAEPLVNVVPMTPAQAADAEGYRLAQFQAFDLLAGRLWPQIGGTADLLDVVGVNYYPQNQWEHCGGPILRTDPRYRPLRTMLAEVFERYGRPLVVAETGVEADERAGWLRDVCAEVCAAMESGVPVEGVCWYPIANHPGWDDDRHCPNGLLGYADDDGHRPVFDPLAAELARQQARVGAGVIAT